MAFKLYLGILPVATHGFIHAQPRPSTLLRVCIFQMNRQPNCSHVLICRQITDSLWAISGRTYASTQLKTWILLAFRPRRRRCLFLSNYFLIEDNLKAAHGRPYKILRYIAPIHIIHLSPLHKQQDALGTPHVFFFVLLLATISAG